MEEGDISSRRSGNSARWRIEGGRTNHTLRGLNGDEGLNGKLRVVFGGLDKEPSENSLEEDEKQRGQRGKKKEEGRRCRAHGSASQLDEVELLSLLPFDERVVNLLKRRLGVAMNEKKTQVRSATLSK